MVSTQQDATPAASTPVDALLREAMLRGASDIHLRAGDTMRARVQGDLVPIGSRIFSSDDLVALVERLLHECPTPAPAINDLMDFRFPWGAPGIGRFRVSLLRQRSTFMVVLRVIPFEAASLDALGVPRSAALAMEADRGLVLVTGVPGSGRSSTISALVHHLNTTSTWRRQVVLVEKPIRVLQPDQKCSIVQREVGVDTRDFSSGLESALDHDADVIVLAGDLHSPDPRLVEQALAAAEAGKLVVGKLPTADVTSTFQYLFSRGTALQQAEMRVRVAKTVRGIVSQRLLPRADGEGRVAAMESYLAAPAMQEMLLDPGSFLDLRMALAGARETLGTQTLDQHLGDLVRDGAVAPEVAMGVAHLPAELRQVLRAQLRP